MSQLADGELDARDRESVERHVDGCVPCRQALHDVLALRRRLQADALRFEAPPTLRARIVHFVHLADLADSGERSSSLEPALRRSGRPGASVPSGRRWAWLASGALGGAAITAGAFVLATALEAGRVGHALVDEVVAAHGRAATTGHLVDVGSSDLHTVKPWLSQRLDYSPPVPDLTAAGFALIGGRLDRLEQSSVATLVYGYGHHTIDVFVRPSGDRDVVARPTVIRGFNVAQSRGLGMDWIGVSDVNPAQLQRLMRLLADASGSVGPEPGRVGP